MYVPDASVWVAKFWLRDPFHQEASDWIDNAVERRIELFAPLILLAEVAGAVSRRVGRVSAGLEAAAKIEKMVEANEVILMDVDRALANDSADIAARYRLRGADAIYVAVAHTVNSILITLDNEQRDRAAGLVETITIPRTGD